MLEELDNLRLVCQAPATNTHTFKQTNKYSRDITNLIRSGNLLFVLRRKRWFSTVLHYHILKKRDKNIANLLVDTNLLHLGNKNLEHSHDCLEGKLLFPGLDLQKTKIKDSTKECSSTSLSSSHPKESFRVFRKEICTLFL